MHWITIFEGNWFCPDCQLPEPQKEVHKCTFNLPDGSRCPKQYDFQPLYDPGALPINHFKIIFDPSIDK